MTRSTFFNRPIIAFLTSLVFAAIVIGNLVTGTSGDSILLRLFLILTTQVIITIFFNLYARKQKRERQNDHDKNAKEVAKTNWWKDGLFLGGYLYLAGNITLPLVFGIEYDLFIFLYSAPTAILTGLCWGLVMTVIDRKKRV